MSFKNSSIKKGAEVSPFFLRKKDMFLQDCVTSLGGQFSSHARTWTFKKE